MDAPTAIQPIAGDNLTPRQTAALLNVPEATLAVWRSTNRVMLAFEMQKAEDSDRDGRACKPWRHRLTSLGRQRALVAVMLNAGEAP